MKVLVESREPARAAVDLLALPLVAFERGARLPARLAAFDRALGGQLEAAGRRGDFRVRRTDGLMLCGRARGGPRRVLLLGLGDAAKLRPDDLRQVVGRAVGAAAARGARSLAMPIAVSRRVPAVAAARAMAEGAVLGGYRSDTWRTRREGPRPSVARIALLVERAAELRAARSAVELGVAVAESQNVTRRLSNEPPNVLTPAALGRDARRVAAEVGLACRVFDVPELRRRKMG